MKKLGICLLSLLLLTGCAKTIMSENGSFKKSLKPEYYVKSCYQYATTAQETGMVVGGWALMGIPGAVAGAIASEAMSPIKCDQDLDQAVTESIQRACLYNLQYHSSQVDAKQPLDVYVDPWYFRENEGIMGVAIRITENIPNKEILVFENYQEVRINGEKKVLAIHRENVSEDEAVLERRRHVTRMREIFKMR